MKRYREALCTETPGDVYFGGGSTQSSCAGDIEALNHRPTEGVELQRTTGKNPKPYLM